MLERCAAVLAGVLSLPALCAIAPPPVAPALRPLPGQIPAFRLEASGVQVYQCSPLPTDPNVYTWVLTAPDATLYEGNHSVARWTSPQQFNALDDLSSVSAIVLSLQSDGPDNMPWALLRATPVGDSGIFAGVTSIQRVDTQGGAPPADGCDADHVGDEARAPFTADLFFYKRPSIG